jgi:hypothetical protein
MALSAAAFTASSGLRIWNGEIDVDDLLVAGQHQALSRRVALRPAAHLGLVQPRERHLLHRLDGRGQVIVQARVGLAAVGAEGGDHALLAGRDLVDARRQPGQHEAAADQRDHLAARPPARSAEGVAQAIVKLLEAGVEVGPARSPRPAARRSSGLVAPVVATRRRTPWAGVGVVVPGHQAIELKRDLTQSVSRVP